VSFQNRNLLANPEEIRLVFAYYRTMIPSAPMRMPKLTGYQRMADRKYHACAAERKHRAHRDLRPVAISAKPGDPVSAGCSASVASARSRRASKTGWTLANGIVDPKIRSHRA